MNVENSEDLYTDLLPDPDDDEGDVIGAVMFQLFTPKVR